MSVIIRLLLSSVKTPSNIVTSVYFGMLSRKTKIGLITANPEFVYDETFSGAETSEGFAYSFLNTEECCIGLVIICVC